MVKSVGMLKAYCPDVVGVPEMSMHPDEPPGMIPLPGVGDPKMPIGRPLTTPIVRLVTVAVIGGNGKPMIALKLIVVSAGTLTVINCVYAVFTVPLGSGLVGNG